MVKKIFFMSGLPRSGNTLLSCILNQNPKIKVSANSLVSEILFQLENLKLHGIYQNFPDEDSLNNIIENVFNLYYKNWDCDYIIDRGPWGTPHNLSLIQKYLKNDLKIICPVRDVIEVITSMYIQRNDELNLIIDNWISNGWRLPSDKTIDEVKCEILTDSNGMIEKGLFSVKTLSSLKYKNFVRFIEYNNLVENIEEEIKKIYNFFEIDFYNHDFKNIKQYEVNGIKYNDNIFGCPTTLHHVRNTISKSNTDINIFDKKIISRYSNLEYWRN